MNIQKMLKQAHDMQARLTKMQEEMETREFDGAAGGGAVKAVVNGKSNLLKISIDASLMNADEKEMVEDLIVAAYNDAKNKAEATAADEMGKITGGLNLPAGLKLPF